MSTSPAAIKSLKEFEQTLPTPAKPAGSYISVTQVGNLVYTSGNLPMKDGQLAYTGQVTPETLADAQQAARLCAINCLSAIKSLVGSLENVVRVVKVTGFVSSGPSFYQQPAVINGASDFLQEVFGDAGKHVRSAVGVSALPLNASVEVEMIVEIKL
jgi:enamine deaminase RidA (YjgF/YER057c/UK114 family)